MALEGLPVRQARRVLPAPQAPQGLRARQERPAQQAPPEARALQELMEVMGQPAQPGPLEQRVQLAQMPPKSIYLTKSTQQRITALSSTGASTASAIRPLWPLTFSCGRLSYRSLARSTLLPLHTRPMQLKTIFRTTTSW